MRAIGLTPSAAAVAAILVNVSPAESQSRGRVIYLPGSTQKVCQVTGEFDQQRREPTINRTSSRCAFAGTDLGASFEHEGRTYFLFGDSFVGKAAAGVTGNIGFIQSTFGTQGNFEVMVPIADECLASCDGSSPQTCTSGGLAHFWRDNDAFTPRNSTEAAAGLPWHAATPFANGVSYDAVALIQSNLVSAGGPKGDFDVVARTGDRLVFFRKDASGWQDEGLIVADGVPVSGVSGTPTLIQSSFGTQGNFEVVVPLASGGLAHFWRENDAPGRPWHGPIPFGAAVGPVDAVSLIQSTVVSAEGAEGDLDAVARTGDRLVFFRKDASGWQEEGPIVADGVTTSGVSGTPALIQSSFGTQGNFEVVVPVAAGGLTHYWRENDALGRPWHGPISFGEGVGQVDAAALIQSNFVPSGGTDGNFEVVTRKGDHLTFLWRDPSGPWQQTPTNGWRDALWPIYVKTDVTNDERRDLLDAIAFSSDEDPEDCLALNFVTDPRDGYYWPPKVVNPPIDQEGLEVPIGGFSAEGNVYVFFTTNPTNDPTRLGQCTCSSDVDCGAGTCPNGLCTGASPYSACGAKANCTGSNWCSGNYCVFGRSILTRSPPDRTKPFDGHEFAYLYEASRFCPQGSSFCSDGTDCGPIEDGKFLSVSPVVVRNSDVPGLPDTDGQGVLLFGTGRLRDSDPYLAYLRAEASDVEDPNAWRYFAGVDGTGRPTWTPRATDLESRRKNEAAAAPIFDHPCIGELSVSWNPYLRRWLMLYNCDTYPPRPGPSGINFRSAELPWGPWYPVAAPAPPGERNEALLFEPWLDRGYCNFIHSAWVVDDTSGSWKEASRCDAIYDNLPHPGDLAPEQVQGGDYGPYLIPRFTRGDGPRTTIYYLMSTWMPYEVLLMRSKLKLEMCPAAPQSGCRAPAVPGRASLRLKHGVNDGRDTLVWKWLGGSLTTKQEFGDPTTSDDYVLCIYDATGLVISDLAPAGGICAGRPCWTAKTTGYQYRDDDLTPDGLNLVLLKAGVDPGKARMIVKGKGGRLGLPALATLASPVRVQLLGTSACWEAVYSAPFLKQNAKNFKDTAD